MANLGWRREITAADRPWDRAISYAAYVFGSDGEGLSHHGYGSMAGRGQSALKTALGGSPGKLLGEECHQRLHHPAIQLQLFAPQNVNLKG